MLAIATIGPTEWLLIIVAVVLLFGASRIPQLMKGVGQGVREFKDAVKDEGGDSETESGEAGSRSEKEQPKS